MIILVDMDCVLCDFDKHFVDTWHKKYPDKRIDGYHERESMHIEASAEHKGIARNIIDAPGFYLNLPEIPGGIDAIKQMRELGHDVYIVTSAGLSLPYAPSEKYRWVIKHIGPEWVQWLVITRSKYAVRGDILIDDMPNVIGQEKAEWEHVLYDQPYNRSVTDKRRLNWQDWREILDI